MILVDPPAAPRLTPGGGALFLDRDGVINVDYGHVHRIEDIVFVPGIFALGRAAAAAGLPFIVVTNQAGIARGLYTEAEFVKLSEWMIARFAAEGCPLTRIAGCPHYPNFPESGGSPPCDCRKPEPGMILSAITDFDLDPATSIIIGDKPSDVEAGRRAGLGTRLLLAQGEEHPHAPAATATITSLDEAEAMVAAPHA